MDEFCGSGEGSYGVGSVGSITLDQLDSNFGHVSDESLFESIFSAVDSAGSGYVRVSSLLETIGDPEFGMDPGTEPLSLETLRTTLDPFNCDPYVNKDTFQAKTRDWLVTQRPIEAYRTQSRSRILSMFGEDPNETLFAHSTPTPSPLKRGRNGDDDLSVFSCGSLEGTGGDIVRKSEADLLHEVTDLQFRNRRLQEEIAQLKQQLVQAEDANVAAQNSYVELQKRASMLQSNLDRCKFLETEYSALRQSLSTTEEQLVDANDKKKCLEKDIRLLTIEIQQAEARIQEVESELAAAQSENEDLTSFLMKEQSEVSRLKQQLEDLEAALNYEREQKNEARQSLEEVTRMLQIVQAEKNDLEAQLSRLLEEHPSLRAAASNTSFYLESEMALRRFMPATSTPFRWNDCNETLHEELKRLGVDCESEGPWSLPIFSREEEDDPPPMPIYSQDDTSSSELKNSFDLLASTNASLPQPIDTTSEVLRREMLATEPKVLGDTFTVPDPVIVESTQFLDLLEPSFSPPELNKTVSLPSRRPPAAPRPVRWKSADNLVEEKKSGLLTKTAKLKKLREKQEKQMNAEKERLEMTKPIFKLQSSSENLFGMTMSTDRLLVKSKHVSSQTQPSPLSQTGFLLPDIIHSSQKDLIEFSAIDKPKHCDWSVQKEVQSEWPARKEVRSDWPAPVCDTKRWPIKFIVVFVIMLCALCCVVQVSVSGRNREKCFQPVFIWYPVWEIIDSHLTYTYSGLPPQ